MKKQLVLLFSAALCLFVATPSFAIEDPDPRGTIIIGVQVGPNIGYSFGESSLDIDDHFNFGFTTKGGGFMLGVAPALTVDYVLVDSWWKGHFTVGLAAGGSWISTLPKEDRTKQNAFYFAPRAMYGLNLSPKFEVHSGLAAGVSFLYRGLAGAKPEYSGAGFEFAFIMGGRFNITDGIAATADINVSPHLPMISVGLAYKF